MFFAVKIAHATITSYADELGAFVPNNIPITADLFGLGAGFANPFNGAAEANLRGGPQMLWHGMMRSSHRRANGKFQALHMYSASSFNVSR